MSESKFDMEYEELEAEEEQPQQEEEKKEEPKIYRCSACGRTFDNPRSLSAHKAKCPALRAERESTTTTSTPPPVTSSVGESIYKVNEPDPNKILERVLRSHPDIPERYVHEVLSWADYTPGGLHPSQVAYILMSLKGISRQTAELVAQKYALALMKAYQEVNQPPPFNISPWISPVMQQKQTTPTILPGPVPGQTQLPPPAFGQPQQMTNIQPQTVSQVGFVPPFVSPMYMSMQPVQPAVQQPPPVPPEVHEIKNRMSILEDKLKNALDEMRKITDEVRQARQQQPTVDEGDYEEVVEYVDKDGNVVPPDKAYTMRIRRIPRKRDFVSELLKLKEMGLIISPLDLQRIKEQLTPSQPQEDPEKKMLLDKIEELKKERDENLKRIEELKSMIESMKEESQKKEREALLRELDSLRQYNQRLEAKIEKLEESVRSMPTPEFKSDAYKLVGTALNKAVELVDKRKPLETVVSVLSSPSSKQKVEAGEEERGSILKELAREGLVVRLLKR